MSGDAPDVRRVTEWPRNRGRKITSRDRQISTTDWRTFVDRDRFLRLTMRDVDFLDIALDSGILQLGMHLATLSMTHLTNGIVWQTREHSTMHIHETATSTWHHLLKILCANCQIHSIATPRVDGLCRPEKSLVLERVEPGSLGCW